MADDLVQLGKRVEAARRAAGLSAREVADAARISPAYLRVIERAVNPKTNSPSRPSIEAIRGIAAALELEVGELLDLAGYDPTLAAPVTLVGAPAKRAVDDMVRQIQESAKTLNKRSSFMYLQAVERLKRFMADFQLMSAGTLVCNSEEEPHVTRLAVNECHSHLRAVSFQDEKWWREAGDRYLELHSELQRRGVEMTRIFLVNERAAKDLIPVFERHRDLDIQTFIIDPADIDDYYRRDVVIYDDVLVRTASTTDLAEERKVAEFSDDPGRIARALVDFDALRRLAHDSGGTLERVLARLGGE